MFSTSISAQVNLVSNYSFEDTVICPTSAGQIYNAIGWINPSTSIGSSPDYFNACNSSGSMSVPTNAFGDQNAKTGSAYGGFYAFNSLSPNAYEYAETMLSDSLRKDSAYCVSFNLSLADLSGLATNNIGLYFSKSLTTTTTNMITVTPQLLNTGVLIGDKDEWMKLEWQYIATGGERYLTIGNFYTASTSDTAYVGGAFDQLSYYYLDDVFVGKCATPSENPPFSFPTQIVGNQIFDIKGLTPNTQVTLYNSAGQIVYEDENYQNTLNGIELANGIYIYRIHLSNGEEFKGKLIIVK